MRWTPSQSKRNETVAKFVDRNSSIGKSDRAIQAPDHVDVYFGDAAAMQFTVDEGHRYVVFSATAAFYVAYGANPTAVIGVADVTDGTGSELNPDIRLLDDIAKISVIAAASVVVTMSFYQ